MENPLIESKLSRIYISRTVLILSSLNFIDRDDNELRAINYARSQLSIGPCWMWMNVESITQKKSNLGTTLAIVVNRGDQMMCADASSRDATHLCRVFFFSLVAISIDLFCRFHTRTTLALEMESCPLLPLNAVCRLRCLQMCSAAFTIDKKKSLKNKNTNKINAHLICRRFVIFHL